jgi:hypothetical protein
MAETYIPGEGEEGAQAWPQQESPASFFDPDLAALIGLSGLPNMVETRPSQPPPSGSQLPQERFDPPVEEQPPSEPVQSEIATFFPLAILAPVRNDGAAIVFDSPPAEPSDLRPVTNTEISFGPVQAQGPINNDRAAVIHQAAAAFQPQQIQPNQDVQFFPYPVPISNDPSAIIHQQPLLDPLIDPHAPVYQVGASSDVRFSPAPPPISNDPNRTIMRHEPVPATPDIPYLPQHLSPGSLDVRFSPAPPPISNDSAVTILGGIPAQNLPSPFQPGVIHIGQGDVRILTAEAPPVSPGVINVGGGTVQILPGRHAAPPTALAGDVFFGGGGDTTKQVRSDEVSMGGFSMPDQGSRDVYMAPSGDMTKQAGMGDVLFGGKSPIHMGGADVQMAPSGDVQKVPNQDDTIMTLNIGAVGNQEAVIGATGGEPTANKDHTDVGFGGRGKPRNIKG